MYKKILLNKYTFWALFFLFLQQSIVASSTIWIVKLSEAVVAGSNFIPYLILFVGSLFLVYVPGLFAGFSLEKAKNMAMFKYADSFTKAHHTKPTILGDKSHQSNLEPWLTNESIHTIEETYSIGYDSLATGLNTVLNVIALCYAIDSRFLFGYLISFVILPFVANRFKNIIASSALAMQDDRKSLAHTLMIGWDNIIIGNIYNLGIWLKQYKKQWSAYNNSSAKAVFLTQIASSCAMMLSLLPIAGIFIWVFLSNMSDTAKLVALIATLPRQVQIIQHFEILSTYFMHWHGVVAKLRALVASLLPQPVTIESVIARVKVNEIDFYFDKTLRNFTSVADFVSTIKSAENGRVTIHGKNGTGKTTIINLIKEELGNEVYYMPTHAKLSFDCSQESLSTGQRVKANLTELNNNSTLQSTKILLLDEWDANLDLKNIEDISHLINNLSKKQCVIEIRHRREIF